MATLAWQVEQEDSRTGFWNVGHKPTLIAAFLYFDLAFMVWKKKIHSTTMYIKARA